MKIKVRMKKSIAILDLEGNIDINASDFVETIGWIINNRTRDIVCNFGNVNLIDYVGISLIAVIYKNVLNHKGILKIYNVPEHVKKIFSIVGLNKVFEYSITEEEALDEIKQNKIFSRILGARLRRRFKRVQAKENIEYRLECTTEGFFHKGKIVNLSAEGVFVISKQPFQQGDVLLTRINLLPKPGFLEIYTKVVWVVDKKVQPQYFPGMGLEFYNISSEKQREIIKFVEKNSANFGE